MKNKKISLILKFLIGILSLTAVVLACIFAKKHGYSSWHTRLLYFTQQSNIWIGTTCLSIAILSVIETKKGKKLIKDYMYTLKYIFTVSITITGIIFCFLLAPFAKFNVWTFSSILTHVIVPLLSIADFFIDKETPTINKHQIFLTTIPPFIYYVITSILCILKVDFGLGVPYPYFFMNFYSEVGLFGFKNGEVPELGSVYWVLLILVLILFLGWLFYKNHPSTKNIKNKK